ncbi:MAG: hypothetical protein H8E85_01530 [Candidatus Marinimicrobia bacterium]|nr:hypothetical protein [Candidatus Neomarinimicrobiota bacterium]
MNYDTNDYAYGDYSSEPVIKHGENRPVHLNFGFMYAVNESFRFGMHFQ